MVAPHPALTIALQEAGHGKSASDRKGWSEWEQKDAPTPNTRGEAEGSSKGQKGSKRKADTSDRASPGISRDLPSTGRGWEKRRGDAGRGARARGGGVGGRSAKKDPERLRQMDIASSFKAGAQRSLSDSARSGFGHCLLLTTNSSFVLGRVIRMGILPHARFEMTRNKMGIHVYHGFADAEYNNAVQTGNRLWLVEET